MPKKGWLDRLVPFLLVITIALAFAVGVLWQKVTSMEKAVEAGTQNNAAGTAKESPILADKLPDIAKELSLNEKDFKACLDTGEFVEEIKADTDEGAGFGVGGTPAVFINGRRFAGAFAFEIFKEVIDKELAGKGSNNIKDYSATLQGYYQQQAFDPKAVTIPIGSAPVLGNQDAKVTIIEYSDFECPYCSRFYSAAYTQIKKEYVDTGKAKIVFKQLPLVSIHPNAQKAAEASLCARKQGKFWEWHDKIFEVMSAFYNAS